MSQNAGFAFPRWARSTFFRGPRLAWEAILGKSQHLKDERAKLKTALAFERCCKKPQNTFPRRARTRKKSSSRPAREGNFQLLQHLRRKTIEKALGQIPQIHQPGGRGCIFTYKKQRCGGVNTQESGRRKVGLLAFPPAHPHHKRHHANTAGAEVRTIMYRSSTAPIIRMGRVGPAVGHADLL